MRIFTLILFFLSAVGCRTGSTLDQDGQSSDEMLADMEDLAIEMVHIMGNSWCEPGVPQDRCYLQTDAVEITKVSFAQYYQGEYDVEVDGVLFGESDLQGYGTVAYDLDEIEVSFDGMMSVNASTLYSVEMNVYQVNERHFEVEGTADGVNFDFDVRLRAMPSDYDDDNDACRTTEIGIDCE